MRLISLRAGFDVTKLRTFYCVMSKLYGVYNKNRQRTGSLAIDIIVSKNFISSGQNLGGSHISTQ